MIWIIVSLVLVTAAVWALALVFGLPLWIPILTTVLGCTVLAVLLVLRLLRSRQRAASIERELRRQGDRARTPDRSAAVEEVRARVREAVVSLRRKKLGGDALYALPWYALIGPPGAGKTTALHESQLGLSAVGSRQRKAKTPGSTKSAEVWLCDEAVLIDTAGRYALEDDDDAEWLAFLDALKRTRSKKPLDGVILAYSARDLLTDRPEQLEDKLKRLRLRLEDIGSHFGVVLPVYLLITKMDALPGFADCFGELSPAQSGRVWGATIDVPDQPHEDAAAALKTEFDLLKESLHASLLARLPSHQRSAEVSARLLRFPNELENVRAPLARVVQELFRPSAHQETPVLRGFYFTSGGGDATAAPAAGALAFKDAATAFVAHTAFVQGATRSFFLGELYKTVIFPDRHLATRSKRRARLELRHQLLFAALAFVVILLAIVPPAASWLNNLELIDATRQDVRRARQTAASDDWADGAGSALDALLARYQALQEASERFSVQSFYGPYTAPPLRDAIRLQYFDELRAIVNGPLRQRLSDSIKSSSSVPGLDPAGFQAAYTELQLYLMLAHPEKLNPDLATTELVKTWARASRRPEGSPAGPLESHVRTYVDTLGTDHAWAWPEDGNLVTQARAQLASMPLEELKYSSLEKAAAGAPPVLPEQIFTGESARYLSTRGEVQVPGLYTALGWQKVQPLLKADQASEYAPWVLGRSSAEAPAWGVEQITKSYFDQYIRAWMDFLVGLELATPGKLNDAIQELAALGKSEGPYVKLFRRLAENSRLEMDPPPAKDIKDQALAKLAPVVSAAVPGAPAPAAPPERRVSPVELYFRRMVRFGFGDAAPAAGMDAPASLLSQYLEQLRALEVSLRQLQDTGAEPTTQFRAELAQTSSSVERLLASFDQTERLALEPLLLNPIRGSQAIVENEGRAALADRWRVEVWEPYRRLATRYPFANGGGADVPLPDFGEFFRPQTGTFWRFYQETLAHRFMRSGTRFVPLPAESKAGFLPGFLECLNVAQQISDAVFVDSAAQPAVPFKVKMQSVDARVSETILKVDGQTLVYRNEPERWQTLQWPGKDGPPGASLTVKGSNFEALVRREEGDFGFFRLLAAGGIKPVVAGSVELEATWAWSVNGSESRVTIQFQAPRARHPFLPGFFSRLNCPPAVTSAVAR
jgi:type VI secretion system protein ImpL